MSSTDVVYNAKEKSLEINCKIFTDDFENALRKNYKTKVDLIGVKFQKNMDVLVKKYLETHLQIEVNGHKSAPNYIGFEIDNESVSVYFEIDNVNSLKELKFSNTILYDLFDDQMNLINVENNNIRKTARLAYPNKYQVLLF
ncbi:MAG: hypothetical protein K2Q03_07725 [Sphingobacteriaceae bacterium]|nr:hypothetical protein [Sphingobacteriaceae bacterium]